MDTQTIFAGTLLAVLVLLVIFTWTRYPYAKYIAISRSDSENKYIAIKNIEVIDNRGNIKEVTGVEGKLQLTSGFANSTAAVAAAAGATGDILFNGINMGYVKDTDVAGSGSSIGPVIGFLQSANSTTGYIIFALGCSSKIARINIRSPDDEVSRINLQRVKVYLLDKDKNIIKGAEQIIPTSTTIPSTVHHISFV
jgi:hypothetical protein